MVLSQESTTTVLRADHKDFVTHVAFDFYGRRIATASSDMTVCVWDVSQDSKEWTRTASWKSHFGPVWKVRWSHPEFGQILATCSFDKTVQIYEEVGDQSTSRLARSGIQVGRNEVSNKWTKRATLNESSVSVTDIQFGPRNMGLILAAGTKSGVIRIYEAPDIMNLTAWECIHEFNAFEEILLDCEQRRLTRELSQISIKEPPPPPPVPTNGKEKESVAVKEEPPQGPELRISAMSWSTCRFHRQLLAVSTDSEDERANDCRVVIFEYNEEEKKFELVTEVKSEDYGYGVFKIDKPVSDIAFAPSSGRTFHQLAVAILDQVQIHNISPTETQENVEADKAITIGTVRRKPTLVEKVDYKIDLVAGFFAKSHSVVRIWRLSWNITGSVLSLACSDGSVHIWKRLYPNTFKQIGYRAPGGSTRKKQPLAKEEEQPYY